MNRIDGKEVLDTIKEGLAAHHALNTGRHTDKERERVKAAEDRLTALLNPAPADPAPDADT